MHGGSGGLEFNFMEELDVTLGMLIPGMLTVGMLIVGMLALGMLPLGVCWQSCSSSSGSHTLVCFNRRHLRLSLQPAGVRSGDREL